MDDVSEALVWTQAISDHLSGGGRVGRGTYRQAPYEECSEEEYLELLHKMPDTIDWDSLTEEDDNVEGAQQLACTAGVCEI